MTEKELDKIRKKGDDGQGINLLFALPFIIGLPLGIIAAILEIYFNWRLP